ANGVASGLFILAFIATGIAISTFFFGAVTAEKIAAVVISAVLTFCFFIVARRCRERSYRIRL
ncbi:MAG: hypothetical protein QF408_05660, partial [Pirellulales bacterium]|nr:hypothetical protein [Pirellulales bacterium]